MDAVVIGDGQTNVSLFSGDDDDYPVAAKFISPLMTASFRGEELNCDLAKELTAIYEGGAVSSWIVTLDEYVSINLKKDTSGHIEVIAEGRRYSNPEISARLRFHIDQSYLPAAIAEAKRVFQSGNRP